LGKPDLRVVSVGDSQQLLVVVKEESNLVVAPREGLTLDNEVFSQVVAMNDELKISPKLQLADVALA
jgi:hypothetical protein